MLDMVEEKYLENKRGENKHAEPMREPLLADEQKEPQIGQKAGLKFAASSLRLLQGDGRSVANMINAQIQNLGIVERTYMLERGRAAVLQNRRMEDEKLRESAWCCCRLFKSCYVPQETVNERAREDAIYDARMFALAKQEGRGASQQLGVAPQSMVMSIEQPYSLNKLQL